MPAAELNLDGSSSTPSNSGGGGHAGGGGGGSSSAGSSSSSSSGSGSTYVPSSTSSAPAPTSAPAPVVAKPKTTSWVKEALDQITAKTTPMPEKKDKLADTLGIVAGALEPAREELDEEERHKATTSFNVVRSLREKRELRRANRKPEGYVKPDAPVTTTMIGPTGVPFQQITFDLDTIQRNARRKEREDILRDSGGGDVVVDDKTGEKRRRPHGEVKQMTWEEYSELPAKQKAAVDFNGALVQAVRNDRRMQEEYDPGKTEKVEYKEQLREMFGRRRGSKLFAPQTVALLQELDIEDKQGDLDDYLKLKVAITAEDLKHFEPAPPATTQSSHRASDGIEETEIDADLALAEQFVDSTAQLTKELAKSNRLIQDFRTSAQLQINEAVGTFGGLPDTNVPTMPGFGDPYLRDKQGNVLMNEALGVPQINFDGYLQKNFDALAMLRDPKAKEKQLSLIEGELDSNQYQHFLNYIDARTKPAMRYKTDLVANDGSGADLIRPKRLRRYVGLGQNQGADNG
jgi:hypothetical protein